MATSEYRQLKPNLKPLPCPFCGKIPNLLPKDPKREGDAWGQVVCKNAKCSVQPKCNDGSRISDMRGTGAYIDMAIRRWKKRYILFPIKEYT